MMKLIKQGSDGGSLHVRVEDRSSRTDDGWIDVWTACGEDNYEERLKISLNVITGGIILHDLGDISI